VFKIVIDPSAPEFVYVLEGPFKSTDGGRSWQRMQLGNVAAADQQIDPYHPSALYAATIQDGVYKSLDHGESWIRLGAPLDQCLVSLAIDPAHSSILYVGRRHRLQEH
jgi:photosystem II stability/assembly factor-like uncharacterized protein